MTAVGSVRAPAPVRPAPAGPAASAPGLRSAAVVAGSLLVALLAWWAVATTRVLGPDLVDPITTVATLVERWDVIWFNAQPTLTAAVVGAGALLVATLVGLAVVGVCPWLSPWLTSLGVVLGSIPLISATPALAQVVPRGSALILVVTVLSGLVPVAATLGTAAQTAQVGREDLGALYSAVRLRWWRHVGFWRCIPVLDIGLRAMLPACFVGAIVAEWSGAAGDRGLGGLMANALYSYQAPLLWAGILLATVIAMLLLGVVALLMAPLRRVVG